MKILIVDDSEESLVIARARLAKDDLDIVCARGGQAGLDAARSEKPDLILLDVDMPDIFGFDVCRALKADAGLCMIPVIFLTAMENIAQKVEGLDVGAIDYVMKPFDEFELRARVRAALRTKRFQDLLIERAQIDPLTELPNRRALMERLRQEWSRLQRHGGRLSFVMADVDDFKSINDTHGHSMGDRYLRAVASTIAVQCRQSDLPARYGGDEFAIIVPDESAAGAARLAERCRRSVEAISLGNTSGQVHTTVSFGVADAKDADSLKGLVDLADRSLYEAKQARRSSADCPDCPTGA